MTQGDMPLGWGWLAPRGGSSGKYFVVKYKQCSYFYTSNRNHIVKQHDVNEGDGLPDVYRYPHFFLPVGVI